LPKAAPQTLSATSRGHKELSQQTKDKLSQLIMETGDQLVGNSVPVTLNGYTYHPQTQDILLFFTRETPSSALGGLYIFPNDPNVPNAPAPACP